MIGFDLDGVILSDIDVGCPGDLAFRLNHIKPIFQPIGDYIIITGRPLSDLPMTVRWLKDNLQVQPVELYHGCPSMDKSSQYKSEILNAHTRSLTFFVESDRVQTQYLRNNTRTKIFHFSDWITSNLVDFL